MNCKICGKPASIHLTEVRPSSEKSDAHYCLDHAGQARLSADQAQGARTRETAQQQFLSFVRVNRRVPTPEEMHEIGVPGAADSDPKNTVEFWKRVAEEILAESNERS